MVVMVGGKVVPDGSNYNTLITTAGGPQFMSEEKEEVDSIADVEAEEVVDGDDEEDHDHDAEEDDGKEFSNYIENLPNEIIEKEGNNNGSPRTPNKAGPPATTTNHQSAAVNVAKAAVAAAVARVGGAGVSNASKTDDDNDDDDGGGKPSAIASPPVGGEALKPKNWRTTFSADKDSKWMAMLDSLKEFKRINGHCNVPYHRPPMLTSFQSWCHCQRRLYKSGKMQPFRVQALEALGFLWSAPAGGRGNRKGNPTFEERLEQLKAYKEKNGTIRVSRATLDIEEMGLNQWCFTQKEKYHSASLPADRIRQLDEIEFDWGEAIAAPAKRGRPTKDSGGDDSNTTTTTTKQPAKRGRSSVAPGETADGNLASPPAKRARMAPSPPPPDEKEWSDMFDKLQRIKRQNKTLPVSFPDDVALDRWVRHQKLLLRKEDLHRDRMVRLHRLGFELPAGATVATYQNKKVPPAANNNAKAAPAPAAAKTTTTTNASAKKSPLLHQPTAKKPAAATTTKAPFIPPRVIPPVPPTGATAPPVGGFPPGPFNPFMPPFPSPYGLPPGLPPPNIPPFGIPPGMPGAAVTTTTADQKKKAAVNMQAAAPTHNQHLQLFAQNVAQNSAMQQSQNASQQAMQTENAKLRAENEQLQAMHNSLLTSLEEEKMVRRQGNQDLQRRIEKQEQMITNQGSTIKAQGEQIKQLMDQMKDVITRQKEQQRIHEEKQRAKEEKRRQQQQEEIRQAERQRQRDMAELQRQQEEQERQEQQRQLEALARQNELYVLQQRGFLS